MVARLTEFRVEKLFGLYNHTIPVNTKQRITIIIGPNGRGKTVCLKFIEAFFAKKPSYFADIDFEYALFTFSDDESIKVESIAGAAAATGDGVPVRLIRYTLRRPGYEDVEWIPSVANSALWREIHRHISPGWHQLNAYTWKDETDDEEITTDEMIQRYRIPPKLADRIKQDIPEPIGKLIDEIDCHLIEAQRLLVFPANPHVDREFPPYYQYEAINQRSKGSRLAVQQKAANLASILGDTLKRYANKSQSLERTFPLRVFEAQGSAKFSEAELRAELRKLDERRDALMTSGLLDTDYRPVSLRDGDMQPGVAMALEIYVKDTTEKLNVFNDMGARIDLFKKIINDRLIDKELKIDRENGFEIVLSNGTSVPLDKLSSGEQHELILIFDLIFEIGSNSLILLDEPELSLHVSWQRSFIDSLSKIIALNPFDILLATHSPSILAKHFDLSVELAPVDK
ncbi:MAG: AAA family ATPase [Negativicutes bacterium]|nr:AAA family ATPase [Negativicutes bacterium]